MGYPLTSRDLEYRLIEECHSPGVFEGHFAFFTALAALYSKEQIRETFPRLYGALFYQYAAHEADYGKDRELWKRQALKISIWLLRLVRSLRLSPLIPPGSSA